MTLSKKKEIFEKTREIISRYEQTGISKNILIEELQREQVASRITVLAYLPEMTDPKRGNIIELRVPEGKINPLCFPTKSNLFLVGLKKKFKLVKDLLDLVEEHPTLGDCFIPLPKLRNIYYDSKKIAPDTGYEDQTISQAEFIHSKKTSFGNVESFITLRSHKARHDLLKELSIFLTLYLSLSKRRYPEQVKTEAIKILTPIFLRALKIFNNDYLESLNVSKRLKEEIQETAPQDAVVIIRLIKPPTMPHVEVEFLKILGRYYYSMSKQFSKKMELDSCKEQKIISNFIKSFYKDYMIENNSNEVLDLQEIEKVFSLIADLKLYRDKDDALKEYGFDKNSIVIRLVRTFYKDEEKNDDALHIKIYYFKLFLTLDIFNKKEQQLLDYVIKQDEETFKSKEWDDPKEKRDMITALFPEQFSKKKYE